MQDEDSDDKSTPGYTLLLLLFVLLGIVVLGILYMKAIHLIK